MYYHASNIAGITELRPNTSNHKRPLVYFTEKRENSLVYLSNAVEKYCKKIGFQHEGSYYKWASYGFSKEGILVLEEYWPNAIEETYVGVSGYIYSTEEIPDKEPLKDIPFAIASTVCVPVQNCEYVPDAYQALKEAADKGLIKIRKYSEMSEQTRAWLKRCIKSEYAKAEEFPEYGVFLKAKFEDFL